MLANMDLIMIIDNVLTIVQHNLDHDDNLTIP